MHIFFFLYRDLSLEIFVVQGMEIKPTQVFMHSHINVLVLVNVDTAKLWLKEVYNCFSDYKFWLEIITMIELEPYYLIKCRLKYVNRNFNKLQWIVWSSISINDLRCWLTFDERFQHLHIICLCWLYEINWFCHSLTSLKTFLHNVL